MKGDLMKQLQQLNLVGKVIVHSSFLELNNITKSELKKQIVGKDIVLVDVWKGTTLEQNSIRKTKFEKMIRTFNYIKTGELLA